MNSLWTLYEGSGESLPEKELQGVLCRALARAMAAGPREGLAEIDRLAGRPHAAHVLPATRAELLRQLGRSREAAAVFLQAATMAESPAARESFRRRSADLLGSGSKEGGRRLAC